MVTEYDIAVVAASDRIATQTCQDAVVTCAAVDKVILTVGRFHRRDAGYVACRQQTQRAGQLVDDTMIAEDDILTIIAVNRIFTGCDH